MIKPCEVSRPTDDTVLDVVERLQIEQQFDRCIRHAEASRHWPARVTTTRAGWRPENVAAVIERYRAAGWSVSAGTYGSYAIIDLPAVRP